MKRLINDLKNMEVLDYRWGRVMTSNQFGLMIGWGTSIAPKQKYISIEIPFLIIQIFTSKPALKK
jgi:hypothetical protein